MKLYDKKLRNREDLHKEKRRLNREKRELEKEPLLSLDEVMGEAGSLGSGLVSRIIPLAANFSGPLAGIVGSLVGRFMNRKKSKSHDDEYERGGEREHHPNVLKSAAKEVLGNYLKWKALELSYKGISLVVRKRKKKKAERKAMEAAALQAMERGGMPH